MSYNDYMYAVDRSDEYLAHYGIKGMKWGVQKALASGNDRKLARQYKKAQKKLAKLEKRAANGSKYAKRAAALGAGAAAAGGLAALGTKGVSNALYGGAVGVRRIGAGIGKAAPKLQEAMVKRGIRGAGLVGRAGAAADRLSQTATKGLGTAGTAVAKWGNSNSMASAAGSAAKKLSGVGLSNPKNMGELMSNAKTIAGRQQAIDNVTKGISNNAIARVGAAAIGAGLAGAAGYNAYRAATTKRAAAKAQQFKSEMNKAFAGTKYANGGSKKRRRR